MYQVAVNQMLRDAEEHVAVLESVNAVSHSTYQPLLELHASENNGYNLDEVLHTFG